MLKVKMNEGELECTTIGSGITLMAELGALTEHILTQIAKQAPNPKEMRETLYKMFSQILVDQI